MGLSYLDEGEHQLRKQKVKGTQKTDKQALQELYRQETNRKIFFLPILPYVYFYQWGLNNYDQEELVKEREETISYYDQKISKLSDTDKITKLDKKKRKKLEKIDKKLAEGNTFMRLGEPLSTLDSSNIKSTAEQMSLYLNTKGFLESEVDYEVKLKNKRAKVAYHISEGPAYIIDTMLFVTNDTNMANLLQENARHSVIRQQNRYDQEQLVLERERIEALMRNNGYYNFSRQYINFRVYDTLPGHELVIETVINNPKNGSHKIYTVDSVIFHTDESLKARGMRSQGTYFNNKTYKFSNRRFSEKILDQRIFIDADKNYSYENTLETQRQLANLDNFKFINIYYDSTGNNFIANIYASPLNKFETTNEVGLGIIVSEGFPSPFYSFSLKNRNVFGSLENMELSARVGIEGLPSATDARRVYRSFEAGGNFSLTFPQFALPLGTTLKRRLGNINPKTKAVAGAAFTKRPEYQRNTFNTSLSYSWQKGLEKLYNFTLIDLNLINSRFDSTAISREFQQQLREFANAGNLLINSFEPSFINSMAFSLIYNYNNYGLYTRKSSLLKLYVENGGTVPDLSTLGVLDHLQHYKYYKVFVEWRLFRPTGRTTSTAFRTFLGVANPFNESKTLPYEKYFFAGGSNGIRAWRPRRLGPGSYTPTTTVDGVQEYNDSLEQPAEILFEANMEIRKKLIGFLEGAFFIDVGNSWTLRKNIQDEDGTVLKPGADFSLDRFYKEIAVGSGLGCRLDFSFLIIRFDVGFKIYDPARPIGSRFVLNNNFNAPPFHNAENYTLNLGIGYPF